MSEQEQPQTEQIPESTEAEPQSYLIFKYIYIEIGNTLLSRKAFGMIRVDEENNIIVTFDQKNLEDSHDNWILKADQITYGEMTFLDEISYMGTGQELVDQLSEE